MPHYQFNGASLKLEYPAVMGILNLTPDSFSDGGEFIAPKTAIEHARLMIDQGAQIIDIGAECTHKAPPSRCKKILNTKMWSKKLKGFSPNEK